ncbi:hypothetical protein FisN_4Hh024 [Fistulifera solaris]|uniref:FHA domain-containing protein n=1 Tax=Fistulifera solaris TaxID=1519565 RepID=A0A1Z5KQJ6_FISSO|nr:hypothetical protein FisN_4Hh024 [Fistulifera solaris]|eukprot:GAX28362.1 hypothetical protein FisN_4Hh024 [Fistulifera solaris]
MKDTEERSEAVQDDDLDIPNSACLDYTDQRVSLVTTSGTRITIGCESLLSSNRNQRCLLVGRQASTSDVRIQHGTISRKHAAIFFLDRSLVVKDLGGKHGTTINDARLPCNGSAFLKDGDRILFGNANEHLFVVRIEPDESDANDGDTSTKQSSSNYPQRHDQKLLELAGAGLSGRDKRQAEISAMMATLDNAPVYQKPVLPTEQSFDNVVQDPQVQDESQKMASRAKKYQLPITNVLKIPSESGRRNSVTALAVDPMGARFVIGSTDNHLRFYDFAGMNRGRQTSFRTVTPEEGHWPVSCAFSNTGDRLIVGTTSVQPVVLDREGQEEIQFVRGDMYVTDQSKTSGHTAAVTAVDWHPFERNNVLTASADGSVRLWKLNGRTQFKKLVCDKVYSVKSLRGQRTSVTALCFHPSGREFAVGTSCGSIQIWNPQRASGRPERTLILAHGDGKPVTSLTYNIDGTQLASRSSEDDQVYVWDPMKVSRSSDLLATCAGAPSLHEHANVAFNQDGTILCIPTSESRSQTEGILQIEGKLQFYKLSDTATKSKLLLSYSTGDISPTIVKWHHKLNQIFLGCADGCSLVFYDLKMSTNGALIPSSKAGKTDDSLSILLNSRAPSGSAGVSGEIVTPFSLPMYRDEQPNESKRRRLDRKDPLRSKEPERPATGKHKIGGQTGGSNFAMFVADQSVSKTKPIAGRDPREALFQYSEGKSFIGGAYQGNESKLAEKTAEEDLARKGDT